ncbi:alpha/beta fold hydrolase [Sutcliffiella rhizosphaerae]|uniref:alpha/beta fold hydrolase n=1 Tax=Sutcliffiella rhizosphaerae TaxID=2880967 RepID=UPI001E2846B4|nr:alpha/beta hydrolase [Sutcliffiella rhizosphaerae]
MPSIQIPTVIIYGIEERTVPVSHTQKARQLIPNSELVLINEARHWSQNEKPEEFLRHLKGYLSM